MTTQPPSDKSSLPQFARRFVLVGGALMVGGAAARWYNASGRIEGAAVSVSDAHSAALSGQITLVDIRRPDEWALTGVGEGAIPIDMRDQDFIQQLLTHVQNRNAPVALICARGGRSRHMTARLTQAGFTNIIDVPEGMLGSGAGPGWLAAGLPVTRP